MATTRKVRPAKTDRCFRNPLSHHPRDKVSLEFIGAIALSAMETSSGFAGPFPPPSAAGHVAAIVAEVAIAGAPKLHRGSPARERAPSTKSSPI